MFNDRYKQICNEMFGGADTVQDAYDFEEYKAHNSIPFTLSHTDQRSVEQGAETVNKDSGVMNKACKSELRKTVQLLIDICKKLRARYINL